MKLLTFVLVLAAMLVWSGLGFCESNGLAIGVEKVTKAPFTLLKDGNESLFTPIKDINRPALDFSDHARAAVVCMGLNFGEPVKVE